jgi:hypothetical protein
MVTGPAATSSSVQLSATARFSDNTVRDVTAMARWESANSAFATVSSTGMVTAVSRGEVELRATYQNVVGSMRLLTMQSSTGTFPLTGLVREALPNQRPLAGVRVQVTAGHDFGAHTFTDENGAFSFPAATAGRIFLELTKQGYQTSVVDLTLSGALQRDVWLYPTPPANSDGATATVRCKDGNWSWSQDANTACTSNGGVAYFVCPGPLCNQTL